MQPKFCRLFAGLTLFTSTALPAQRPVRRGFVFTRLYAVSLQSAPKTASDDCHLVSSPLLSSRLRCFSAALAHIAATRFGTAHGTFSLLFSAGVFPAVYWEARAICCTSAACRRRPCAASYKLPALTLPATRLRACRLDHSCLANGAALRCW
jgi:hypothetical protein